MSARRASARAIGLAGLLAVGLLALGCGMNGSEEGSRLRIRNAGGAPIAKLTVLFPNDRTSFGDVAAGATTGYQPVPNGVYRYAAYSLELDGSIVTQPVIDWVGEEPMPKGDFTYTLELAPGAYRFGIVQLLSVTQDE